MGGIGVNGETLGWLDIKVDVVVAMIELDSVQTQRLAEAGGGNFGSNSAKTAIE